MKKTKQFSFFNDEAKSQKFFGGALLEGRRKSIRPLTSKDSIHFVLRSSWAEGSDSFLKPRNYRRIDQIITRFAKKFEVRIYQRSINSNHLHLLLRITNRRLYRSFIKAVSGQIASHVMAQKSFLEFSKTRQKSFAGDGSPALNGGCKKDQALMKDRKFEKVYGREYEIKQKMVEISKSKPGTKPTSGFWEFRPFSRVVAWGKDFKSCVGYLKQSIGPPGFQSLRDV